MKLRRFRYYVENNVYPLYIVEHGVGLSQANRREARKLGLLPSGKSSEAERERMKPQERNERV